MGKGENSRVIEHPTIQLNGILTPCLDFFCWNTLHISRAVLGTIGYDGDYDAPR